MEELEHWEIIIPKRIIMYMDFGNHFPENIRFQASIIKNIFPRINETRKTFKINVIIN